MPPKRTYKKTNLTPAEVKKAQIEAKKKEEQEAAEAEIKAIQAAFSSLPDDPELSFQIAMEQYRLFSLRKYFKTTTKGRAMSTDQFTKIRLNSFNDPSFWLEPGYRCTDYAVDPETGILASQRVMVRLKHNSEAIDELVYEHGTVCIHAAVVPWMSVAQEMATLWLVSVVDDNGVAQWPATWIHHDDFDGLVRHASSPRSEYWRNNCPWTLNIAPDFLFRLPQPMVKVTGLVPVRENLPFNYQLGCEFYDGDLHIETRLLHKADLVECFSYCLKQTQHRSFPLMQTHRVIWKDMYVVYPRIESPLSDLMMDPYFWADTVIHRQKREGDAVDVPGLLTSASDEHEGDDRNSTDYTLRKALGRGKKRDALTIERWNEWKQARDAWVPTEEDFEEFMQNA